MQHHRVLALAPHTDDVELGCGAAVARLVEEGSEVFVAAFSIAEDSVPPGAPRDTLRNEFLRAVPQLGVPADHLFIYEFPVRRLSSYRQEVLETLVLLRRQIEPDLVLLPSAHDVHQDHRVIHAEGGRAFKGGSIFGYELPWNHLRFAAQAFVVIEPRHLDRKWAALQEYHSQFQLERAYFSREFFEGLARVRGTQIKAPLAEAFEVVRLRL